MGSTGKLALSVKERRAPTSADQALVDTLQSKANWMWCPDTRNPDGPDPPSAPDGEQCIFRNKFFYPTGKGKPTKTSLILAADDYMALYVDGVMIQAADITHDWKLLYAFEVPLPVIQNQTTSSLLLGLRGVNRSTYVGLIAAVRVDYETGEPDVFYTGLNEEWRAQRIFDEGWEQPWYNANTWRPSSNISQRAGSPSDQMTNPGEVAVFEALPAEVVSTGADPSQVGSDQRTPVDLSVAAFAGILVGSILVALAVGAVGAYFILRRRLSHQPIDAWSDSGGVASREHGLMSEPLQLPNEPHPSLSYAQPISTRASAMNDSYHPRSSSSPPTQDTSPGLSPTAYVAPPTYSDLETPVPNTVRRK